MMAAARPSAVLAPGVFLDSVRQAAADLDVDLLGTFADLERLPEAGADLPPVKPDDVCYCNSPPAVPISNRRGCHSPSAARECTWVLRATHSK